MRRLIPIAVLALLAASCGGGGGSKPAASKGASKPAFVATGTPHVQARTYLEHCEAGIKPVSFENLKEVIKQFTLYWTLVSVVPQPRKVEAG